MSATTRARITIEGWQAIDKRAQKGVTAWLRRTAKELEQHPYEYANRIVFRKCEVSFEDKHDK